MTRSTRVIVIALFALAPGRAWAQAAIVPVPGTTTRDIPFTSHDGYPMLGRLTLPDAPGPHPVLILVQTAEAATMDGKLRNSKGVRVRIYNQYRDLLAPMGIGFFSYEGRGRTMTEWVKDHLSQPTMWDLMSKLHMPVGLFRRP